MHTRPLSAVALSSVLPRLLWLGAFGEDSASWSWRVGEWLSGACGSRAQQLGTGVLQIVVGVHGYGEGRYFCEGRWAGAVMLC